MSGMIVLLLLCLAGWELYSWDTWIDVLSKMVKWNERY